jgi:tetratricopeptide (TPR) repeat protein
VTVADRIEELRRRVEADPGSRLFAQLAEALRKDGELEEAIGIARAGLERHPDYPSARLTLGRALLDSGDPAAARGELEAAVRGAPDNILASRVLGEALETLGELGPALERLKTTLQMAPSDLHVQARIKAIEERGAKPAAAAEPAAKGEPEPERSHTKPMAAVKREDLPAPGGEAAEVKEEEEEALPPTIRIRMPGDPVGGVRAPMPPKPPADKEGGPPAPEEKPPAGGEPDAGRKAEETTLPAPTRLGEAEDKGEGDGAKVFGETAAGVASGAGAEEPRTLPKGRPPALEPGGAGADAAAAPAGEALAASEGATEDSDLTPTLPTSKAAEYAGLDPSLPPTVPPGVVTSARVEGAGSTDVAPGVAAPAQAAPTARGDAPESRPEAAPFVPPPSESPGVAEEPAAAGEPPPVPEPAPSPPAPSEPPPPQGEGAAPGPTALEPADRSGTPLSSGTLAELYFQQGLLKRALEVYHQVLQEEPDNDKARARLSAIQAEMEAAASNLKVAPSEGEAGDGAPGDTGARRRALERTIEKLEALLDVVRARRR